MDYCRFLTKELDRTHSALLDHVGGVGSRGRRGTWSDCPFLHCDDDADGDKNDDDGRGNHSHDDNQDDESHGHSSGHDGDDGRNDDEGDGGHRSENVNDEDNDDVDAVGNQDEECDDDEMYSCGDESGVGFCSGEGAGVGDRLGWDEVIDLISSDSGRKEGGMKRGRSDGGQGPPGPEVVKKRRRK